MRSLVRAAAVVAALSFAAPSRADRFRAELIVDPWFGFTTPVAPASWRQQNEASFHASLRAAIELRHRFVGFAPEFTFNISPWFFSPYPYGVTGSPGARFHFLGGGRLLVHFLGDHALFVRALGGSGYDFGTGPALEAGGGVELRFDGAHWLVTGAACDVTLTWHNPSGVDGAALDVHAFLFFGARVPIYRLR